MEETTEEKTEVKKTTKKAELCPLNEDKEVSIEECRKCGFHDCPVRKV